MKQPTFNWDTEDKYSDVKEFKLEVINVLKSYVITVVEKTALIKNWLRGKGLQSLETATEAEQKMCSIQWTISNIKQ